jgi:hypothetical protein
MIRHAGAPVKATAVNVRLREASTLLAVDCSTESSPPPSRAVPLTSTFPASDAHPLQRGDLFSDVHGHAFLLEFRNLENR